MNNKAIYLCGVDGSGKTTFISEIEKYLKKKGIHIQHVWLRSPKILSKPLMAYCRFVGLTRYKVIDEIRYGGHEFYRSKFVSWLFPVLQLIDFKIKWTLLKRKLNTDNVVLFDRFALDTLADLMADTHRFNLHKTWLGKQFIYNIPSNTKIFVLNTKTETIRSRKLDTKHDPLLETKVKVYNILGHDLNLESIDNEQPKEKAIKELIEKINR